MMDGSFIAIHTVDSQSPYRPYCVSNATTVYHIGTLLPITFFPGTVTVTVFRMPKGFLTDSYGIFAGLSLYQGEVTISRQICQAASFALSPALSMVAFCICQLSRLTAELLGCRRILVIFFMTDGMCD